MISSEWNNHLFEGEEIIWQGRPDQNTLGLAPMEIFRAIFGTFFAGFAFFWMIMASRAGGAFWAFGLLHFGAGVGLVLWSVFGGRFVRRSTWYTLTNKRAFIASDLPFKGRSLKSYSITDKTEVEYVEGPLPSLMFATITKRTNNGYTTVPIGFEYLHDGVDVQRLIRDVQQGKL